MSRSLCAVYTSTVICVLFIISGITLLVDGVFHNRFKGEITLKEGSKVFNKWKNSPAPVFMEFFFYNVTNPDEFLAGGKPRVTTMGPYTYREHRSKENITFMENGTKVSAVTPKTFVFVREMSVGDPSEDSVTTVNIPAVAVMNDMKHFSFFIRPLISMYIKNLNTTMFMTRTVEELLWGYKDPLLTRLHNLKPEVDEYFGLMLNKNGSHDGEFVYFNGEQSYLEYGRIDTWKGQKLMTFWKTNQSNMINGTDGSAFHPFLTKEERLDVFTADLCRSIYMLFEKEVEVKGIPAYRYTPPHDVLASAKKNLDNEGFCLEPDKEECLDDGVLNIAVCRKDAPFIVSFPHFYLADQKYVDAIEGISPVHEHHQTFLDLNPTTGELLRVNKGVQINIQLNRIPGFPMTRTLNGTIFPIMFYNESFITDDASAELLSINSPVNTFSFILIALGLL